MSRTARTTAWVVAIFALSGALTAALAGTCSAAPPAAPAQDPLGEGHFRLYLDGKLQTRVAPAEVAKATEKYTKLHKNKTVTTSGPFYSAKAVRDNAAAMAAIIGSIPGVGGSNANKMMDAYLDKNYPAAAMAYGDKVSLEFRTRVREVAAALGVPVDDLMTLMALETGGKFLPGKYASGAVGLIQFTPTGVADLGTTVEELAKLTAVQQLDWVQKYMELQAKRHGALTNRYDMYCAIFCPSAVGKPGTYVAYDKSVNEKRYNANKSLDTNNDGQITRDEIDARVRQWNQNPQNVWIDVSKIGQ